MTKITLAMLLGAVCASTWWAYARWGLDYQKSPLIAVAIVTTIGCAFWIVDESITNTK